MVRFVSLPTTFNRTTLELKPDEFGLGCKLRTPFNRTTLELKPIYLNALNHIIKTFNRTTLELKLFFQAIVDGPANHF